jgi:hypothetical protein
VAQRWDSLHGEVRLLGWRRPWVSPKDVELARMRDAIDHVTDYALEQRLDKTRLIKQGMMQELLTGRTRLV